MTFGPFSGSTPTTEDERRSASRVVRTMVRNNVAILVLSCGHWCEWPGTRKGYQSPVVCHQCRANPRLNDFRVGTLETLIMQAVVALDRGRPEEARERLVAAMPHQPTTFATPIRGPMIKLAILLLSVLTTALPAAAQEPATPITGVVLNVYRAGQSAPATTPLTIPRASWQCDLAPTAAVPGVAQNPNLVLWDDPDRPGRDCRYVDPATGVLTKLAADPTVTYEAAIHYALLGGGQTEASARVPFQRPGITPAAPARLRLVRTP